MIRRRATLDEAAAEYTEAMRELGNLILNRFEPLLDWVIRKLHLGNQKATPMKPCEHGELNPHFITPTEPSYFEPERCGGSSDNWFTYSTRTKLHRWVCDGDAGSMTVLGPRHLYLASVDDVWVLPVGVCCRVDKAQRFVQSLGRVSRDYR